MVGSRLWIGLLGRDHGCHAATASSLGGGEAGAGKHTRIPISRIHVTEDSTSQLIGPILAINMDILFYI